MNSSTGYRWHKVLIACCLPALLALCGPSAVGAAELSAREQDVLRAYLAYYGRPPDAEGLAYWTARAEESGSLQGIMGAFGNSSEFRERFGDLSKEALVNNLYRQTFGRDAEAGGLRYWVARLESGALSLSEIALKILFAAKNDDALVVTHRALVGASFVQALDSPSARSAYRGSAAAEALAGLMATVTAEPLSAILAMERFHGRVADFIAETAAEPLADIGSGDDQPSEGPATGRPGDGNQHTEDLFVPDGFAFSSSWVLPVDIDVNGHLQEAAYLLICSDFAAAGDGGYDIDYGTCQLRTPLINGSYRSELTMTDTVETLLIAVLPLAAPDEAIYFERNSLRPGVTLKLR